MLRCGPCYGPHPSLEARSRTLRSQLHSAGLMQQLPAQVVLKQPECLTHSMCLPVCRPHGAAHAPLAAPSSNFMRVRLAAPAELHVDWPMQVEN